MSVDMDMCGTCVVAASKGGARGTAIPIASRLSNVLQTLSAPLAIFQRDIGIES